MICSGADGWTGWVNTDTASAEGAHAEFHVGKLSWLTLREHEAGNDFRGEIDFVLWLRSLFSHEAVSAIPETLIMFALPTQSQFDRNVA